MSNKHTLQHIELSPTLQLTEISKTSGHAGWWLYDETRGMNLAMKANTEREAFVEALEYYQERLTSVEGKLKSLSLKVDAFVSQFAEEDEDYH